MERVLLFVCSAALVAVAASSPQTDVEKSTGSGMSYKAQQMYITQNYNGYSNFYLLDDRTRNITGIRRPDGFSLLQKKLDHLIGLIQKEKNDTAGDGDRDGTDWNDTIGKFISNWRKQTDLNKEVLLKMTDQMLKVITDLVTAQAKDSSSADSYDIITSFNSTLRKLDEKLEEISRYVKQKGCVGNDTDDDTDTRPASLPKDCEEVYDRPRASSGVYTIQPDGAVNPKDVWCEMGDRKWTVLMRRFNGSVSFDRNWQEYKNGFGSASGEYWIGNEYMHLLTRNRSVDARFDMTDWFGGRSTYAVYRTFSVGSEASKYKLSIGTESGTAKTKWMTRHNDKSFTTKDRDNDSSSSNCARTYGGGWWHRSCYYTFFTGPYRSGCKTSRDHKCMVWDHNIPLKAASIKIARKN